MRRIKSDGLHPAAKIAQAIGGSYADPENDTFSFNPPNAWDNPWSGLTIIPPPAISESVNKWVFHKEEDIDVGTWVETKSGGGTSPALIDKKGGGMEYETGPNNCNRNTYTTPKNIVKICDGGNVWIEMEVRFTDPPTNGDFYLGFTNGDDSDFKITFKKEAGEVTIQAQGTTDYTSVVRTVTPVISGSDDPTQDLFDGEWHTITIKIGWSPTVNTEGTALIFVDDKWVGEIWMNDEDYQSQSRGIPTAEELMAVQFSSHTLGGGGLNTGIGSIIVLQQ